MLNNLANSTISYSVLTHTNLALQDFHGGLRVLHTTASMWIKKIPLCCSKCNNPSIGLLVLLLLLGHQKLS